MASYVEIHPVDPQPRLVEKVVERLRQGDVAAIPTDSGYALVSALDNKEGLDRIRALRQVGDKHHFTMLCHNFTQLGQFIIVVNPGFRLVKSPSPCPSTFVLKGTKEVPRRTLHPKKHTVGVRIPDHKITQALVQEMGEPLLASSLILPGHDEPMTEGWEVNDELGGVVDIVVEGPCGEDGPTTVVNLVKRKISREGAGDISGINL